MGSKGSKSVTQTTSPHPKILKAYLDLVNRAQGTADKPYEAYSGDLVAGFSPMQQQAFDNVSNYAASAGTRPVYEDINQYFSPYQDEVVNKTMENMRANDALQQERLKADAINSGAWGGNRASLAANDLTRNQNMASGQVIAGLRNTGYQNAQNVALNDASRLNQERLAGLTALTTAGNQQQQQQQNELSSAYQQWQAGKSYPFQRDQWLSGIIGSIGPQAGGSATTQMPQPSALQQIAGLGMTGLGLFGGMGGLGAMGKGSSLGGSMGGMALSDERAKEDVVKVGELEDGTPVYRFRYKGDPKTQIGLIAQDVEQRKPEAVEEVNGTKFVDYETATEDSVSKAEGGAVREQPKFGSGIPFMNAPGIIPLQAMKAGAGIMPKAAAPSVPRQATAVENMQKMLPMLQGLRKTIFNRDNTSSNFNANSGLESRAGFAGGGEVDELSILNGPASGIVPLEPQPFMNTRPSGIMPMFDVNPATLPAANPSPPIGHRELLPNTARPVSSPTDGYGGGSELPSEGGDPSGASRWSLDPNSAWLALAAAGLGTLASSSPYAGVAIGEGGLQGLQFLSGQQKSAREREEMNLRRETAAQTAKRLEMQFAQTERRLQNEDTRLSQNDRRLEAIEKREQWTSVGISEDGMKELQRNARTGEIRAVPLPERVKPKTAELTAGDRKIIADGEDKTLSLQNVISNLDEAIKLNEKAYSGPLASQRGYATSIIFGDEEGKATQTIENLVTTQSLGQLKAIFGAAPTEGERKILLDIQGSVNQNPDVRKEIWTRAKRLAEQRLAKEQDKINQIRGGTYYKPQNKEVKQLPAELRAHAVQAIAAGAKREDLIHRLKQQGYDPSGI